MPFESCCWHTHWPVSAPYSPSLRLHVLHAVLAATASYSCCLLRVRLLFCCLSNHLITGRQSKLYRKTHISCTHSSGVASQVACQSSMRFIVVLVGTAQSSVFFRHVLVNRHSMPCDISAAAANGRLLPKTGHRLQPFSLQNLAGERLPTRCWLAMGWAWKTGSAHCWEGQSQRRWARVCSPGSTTTTVGRWALITLQPLYAVRWSAPFRHATMRKTVLPW